MVQEMEIMNNKKPRAHYDKRYYEKHKDRLRREAKSRMREHRARQSAIKYMRVLFV